MVHHSNGKCEQVFSNWHEERERWERERMKMSQGINQIRTEIESKIGFSESESLNEFFVELILDLHTQRRYCVYVCVKNT